MLGTYRQVKPGRYSYDLAFELMHTGDASQDKLICQRAFDWCAQQFGPCMDDDGIGAWGAVYECIVFNDRANALLFKITWC